MARLLETSAFLILFIGVINLPSVTPTPKENNKRSFLRDFIAARREIFPFSSDLEINEQKKITPIRINSQTLFRFPSDTNINQQGRYQQKVVIPISINRQSFVPQGAVKTSVVRRRSSAVDHGRESSVPSLGIDPRHLGAGSSISPNFLRLTNDANRNTFQTPSNADDSLEKKNTIVFKTTNNNNEALQSIGNADSLYDNINVLSSNVNENNGKIYFTQASINENVSRPSKVEFISNDDVSHIYPDVATLSVIAPSTDVSILEVNNNTENNNNHNNLTDSQNYGHTTSGRDKENGRKINERGSQTFIQYPNSNYDGDFRNSLTNQDPPIATVNHHLLSTEMYVPRQNETNQFEISLNTKPPIAIIQNGRILSPDEILQLLRRERFNANQKRKGLNVSKEKKKKKKNVANRLPNRDSLLGTFNFFDTFMASLRRIPVLGNVLRATVDPIYRPLLNSLLPVAENRQASDDFQEEVHCFGNLGCLVTTIDFYDPIIRPINLPSDTREVINTHYTLYTRLQHTGVAINRHNILRLMETTYDPSHPTKFIIHGFLDDQNSTWIKDMSRALLQHGDYNVFVVDWSGGSRVIYHQAVSNIRLVALEVSNLIKWMQQELGQDVSTVHIIGHSLGSHTAGYIGKRVPGLGRITGLDPAEPFFQYMPASVRLDHTDAGFVDVIHTDTDSIMTLAWQLAGYGLEQAIGHVDFYPNGGREQPGCSSLARIPLTALQDGDGLAEGLDAAEKAAVACNHFMANKLFTASLLGSCNFQAFPCESYKEFEKARCFSCDTDQGCAPLGINADTWQPNGNKHVKMFLSTSRGPDFCQYHYRLTVTLADEKGQGGSLRGRLKVTLITHQGELQDFDLTESSPLIFKRSSTRTFLLHHHEDLSLTRDALVHWQFEADVFNPMTFCVLFCTAELEVATVTLTPLDTPTVTDTAESRSSTSRQSADIVMCQKQGNPVIKIKSEKTIKISAEPFCPSIKRRAEAIRDQGVSLGVRSQMTNENSNLPLIE